MSHTKTDKLFERRSKFVPNGLGIFSPASAVTARNSIIYNSDGGELIDFAGGIGVVNAGHCPEPVVKAIQDQAERLIHTCFNVAIYDSYLDLAEKLIELFPHGDGGTKVMLTTTGAESVENAIKIARQATGRSAVVCFKGAFHGRSMMAMTLTSKVSFKRDCGPFAPEVYRLEYPYYGPEAKEKMDEDTFVENHIRALEDSFKTFVAPQQVACVIIELVQGEGGFGVVSKSYLKALRKLCTAHGIILIFDEVQTGFGRTAEWAAYHHFEVEPDISTWAKSMGSGMPIGCVIGKTKIMDAAQPSTIGGTYPGNPVCAAAALATIRYMEEIGINDLAKKVGSIVHERFRLLQQKFSEDISDVRGLGAMVAIELRKKGRPLTDEVKQIIQTCSSQGLIIISAGMDGNVLRTLSPLTIDEETLNKGLDILEEAFNKVL